MDSSKIWEREKKTWIFFPPASFASKVGGIVQVSVRPMSAMPLLWCGGNRHLTWLVDGEEEEKENTSK